MTGVAPKTREAVYERDGHRCIRCGAPSPLTLQHRRARGMGGSSDPSTNGTANLIVLCGSGTSGCHGWVESHPTEANLAGWRVAQRCDPENIPVLYELEGISYLLDAAGCRSYASDRSLGVSR